MESKINPSTFSRSYRPSGFRNLDQDQIEVHHNASLEIVEPTGMRFFEQEALDLFKKAGAGVSDGNLVFEGKPDTPAKGQSEGLGDHRFASCRTLASGSEGQIG
jgi:hypothetical protein